MIALTVKTLDSQNHQFTVEDDITVEQFKVRIADKVNIPAETQRIIYCGRVLQDSLKLADYDVNGKVVHLVQRAPPGTNSSSNRSASPPQEHGGRFRGFDRGNAMYVGSMAFPGNLMESQGIIPPPPTHSLSGSRLNVARRMLRKAEAVIRLLENPTNTNQQAATEEVPEEEVTPVIEARVIVPSNNTEPIDEVLNAVQNTLLHATAGAININNSSGASGSGTQSASDSNAQGSNSSTPEGNTPRSASSENLASETRSENGGLPENASRGTEMSELLTQLGQLQTRFAPFLERYQNFMQEDPEVAHENQMQTQLMLNRVSEVLHFLGHAYHSLSDIIIRVRNPPPRPLLCRPILIQHSAVVQTGIPIQVEAQINLSADHPMPNPTTSSNSENSANTTSSTATTGGNPTVTYAPLNHGGPTISVQQGFVGLPFMPSGSMRVLTTPMEIRTMRTNGSAPPSQRPNNNNNTVNVENAPTAPPTSASQSSNETSNESSPPTGHSFNLPNNSNVEFFMEVTPEGITIDSLETALVGSNQAANEFLRGALNGPPPEFQSLMQIVNSQILGLAGGVPPNAPPATPQSTAASDQSNAQSAAAGTNGNGTGQNSQARGNTSTNPTTATHTRSTPRPHVQMTQQAMQGGFDPFLPCNSHHISRRRAHIEATIRTQTFQTSNARPTTDAPSSGRSRQAPGAARPQTAQAPNMANFHDFVRSYFNAGRPQENATRNAPPTSNANSSGRGDSTGNTGAQGNDDAPIVLPMRTLLSMLSGRGNRTADASRGGMPTIDQLLELDQDDDQEGGSLIYDLVTLIFRNLTLIDLIAINSGNLEPINRNRAAIQDYFRQRVCDNDASSAGVERGVNRIMEVIQPFMELFSALAVNGNIDMAATLQRFFRQRCAEIIASVIVPDSNNVLQLIDQIIRTTKQLIAIALYASSTGRTGVLQVFEQVLNRAMAHLPQEIRNWTLMMGRSQLTDLMTNSRIPQSEIEQFIVRRSTEPIQDCPSPDFSRPGHGTLDLTAEVEAMDVDDGLQTNEEVPQAAADRVRIEDSETLPQVVIGSEPWHVQVPEDWVPIITRDAQKQRRQNSQGPFSDGYLSGMPSKRRKIINSKKPQGSLPQVISESVRQAVTATGLTSAAPLDTVVAAAGASTEIQTAYRTLLRSTVQANLRDNEDFTPERYPNASTYFNTPPQ